MSAREEPGCLPVLAFLGGISALAMLAALIGRHQAAILGWLTGPVLAWMRWAVILLGLTAALALVVWAAIGSHGAEGRDA